MMANTNGSDRTGLRQDGQRPDQAADTGELDVNGQARGAVNASQSGICGASHDDIARRAHGIYESNGSKSGQCKQNWLQAERELNHQECAGSSSALRT